MAESLQWEYRIQTLGTAIKQPKDEEMEALLNEWGVEGWEVINAHHPEGSNKVRVIAKRLVRKSARRTRSWPE